MNGFEHRLWGILFRFHGVASPRLELRETFYERLFPGYPHFVCPGTLALRPKHDYDNCVHNTILFIKTRFKCKIKCTIFDPVFITVMTVTRYGWRLAIKCSVNPVKCYKRVQIPTQNDN